MKQVSSSTGVAEVGVRCDRVCGGSAAAAWMPLLVVMALTPKFVPDSPTEPFACPWGARTMPPVYHARRGATVPAHRVPAQSGSAPQVVCGLPLDPFAVLSSVRPPVGPGLLSTRLATPPPPPE